MWWCQAFAHGSGHEREPTTGGARSRSAAESTACGDSATLELRALGVRGAIPSPSYTLVEPYDTDFGRVLHVDLYRLRSPQELEDLGMRDEWQECALRLVEWPENGAGALPPAAPAEIGRPFLQSFTPRDYRGHNQVWAAAQDANGVMWFGNQACVLAFDGSAWRRFPTRRAGIPMRRC